jgi:hypothetical protein
MVRMGNDEHGLEIDLTQDDTIPPEPVAAIAEPIVEDPAIRQAEEDLGEVLAAVERVRDPHMRDQLSDLFRTWLQGYLSTWTQAGGQVATDSARDDGKVWDANEGAWR